MTITDHPLLRSAVILLSCQTGTASTGRPNALMADGAGRPQFLSCPVKEVGDPALRLKAEKLVRPELELAFPAQHRHHCKAPAVFVCQDEEFQLPVHNIIQVILPDLAAVPGHDLLCLLVAELVGVAGTVVNIPLPPLQVFQVELQRQVGHVAGDEAAGVLPVQAVDECDLLVGVGKGGDHIGEGRLLMGDPHVGIPKHFVFQILDGPVQADELQLVVLLALVAPGGLDDLPGDKLFQRVPEDVDLAGLAGEAQDAVLRKLPLLIGALHKLPDDNLISPQITICFHCRFLLEIVVFCDNT